MEKLDLQQEDLIRFVSNEIEFWQSYHNSLKETYSYWHNYKEVDLKKWKEMVSTSETMFPLIKILFEFPILKNEFLVVWSSGFLLTNYRLIIYENPNVRISIPLDCIKNYNEHGDGLIEYEINGILNFKKFKKLLSENYLKAAIERFTNFNFDIKEKLFLAHSKNEILKIFTSINFNLETEDNSNEELLRSQKEQNDITKNDENRTITQKDINDYLCTNKDFWECFHKSLNSPYSFYNKYKDETFENWVELIWNSPELISNLNFLFDYPILKEEFYIASHSGFYLTNYRLIINDSSIGRPSIPLSKLKYYSSDNDGIIKFEVNGNLISLEYKKFLKATLVNSAKARFEDYKLTSLEIYFLSKSVFDLKSENSNLDVPKLELYPLTEKQIELREEQNRKNQERLKQQQKSEFSFWPIIIICSVLIIIVSIADFGSSSNLDICRCLFDAGDSSYMKQNGKACDRLISNKIGVSDWTIVNFRQNPEISARFDALANQCR